MVAPGSGVKRLETIKDRTEETGEIGRNIKIYSIYPVLKVYNRGRFWRRISCKGEHIIRGV